MTYFTVVLTDGIGASDFGESLSFQKVLQGQEILRFTRDGADTHNHHPSEARCFFRPNASGIAAIGDAGRNPAGNYDISYNSKGFGESFQFQKVLQGQEVFPSLPYGRALTTNMSRDNGDIGILHGVQVQCNNTTLQVSSPSSVLRFQQATNPVSSSLGSMYKLNNLEEQRIGNRNLSVPETIGGKLTSSSFNGRSLCRKEQGGMNSSGFEHGQLGSTLPPPPCPNRSAFGGSQDLTSSCKSSCRLFGFSLTEEKHVANTEDSTPGSSSLNTSVSFLPHVGDQFHPKPPPLMAKVVGSNCTKVSSDLYAVRYAF